MPQLTRRLAPLALLLTLASGPLAPHARGESPAAGAAGAPTADANEALRAAVKATEEAFAKAFADRDRERFFSYVHPDAVFIGGTRALRGKAAVVERWSRFFAAPKAPFSWRPVVVEAHGDLGVTQGPIYDADGKYVGGNFSSVWQRQADGSWKIVFDGAPPCEELGKPAPAAAPAPAPTPKP
jgi:ketosteroid isomerase-like protein